jgi:hypothetical protein
MRSLLITDSLRSFLQFQSLMANCPPLLRSSRVAIQRSVRSRCVFYQCASSEEGLINLCLLPLIYNCPAVAHLQLAGHKGHS